MPWNDQRSAGSEKTGDDAVSAEQLNSLLVDGVKDFLSGGFASEQRLELRHDDLVHDDLCVCGLLCGDAGGRSDDEADLTGCAGDVALVKSFGSVVCIYVTAGLADGVEEQGGINCRGTVAGAEVIEEQADVLQVLVSGVVVAEKQASCTPSM